jgi:aspartyl-tRNA(Asn)/glutamyl-tRNA(Gln) amidotransferase subunit A
MSDMNIKNLTAAEIAEKVRCQDLTAQECTEKTFERIDKLDDKIRAYITIIKEQALERAQKIDRKARKGEQLGKLAGVPIAVKDNICARNVRTTCASRMLENFYPPYDATVVSKINAEDCIIIGKANMDEFAMGTSTETSYFGPTHNPWDINRVPGGSSGGSAAAVASGEAVLALGSDTGGSIRCPASFVGVVGLKPTYGLVSRYGLIAYANSIEQIGPIAKRTQDCALLLEIIAGSDERDSTSIPQQSPNYSKSLTESLKGLRIGIPKETLGKGTDSKVEETVYNCSSKLEELGAECREATLPTLNYSLSAYYLIAMSEASSNLARFDGMRYGYRIEDEDLDWSEVYSASRQEGFGTEVKRRIILGTYTLSAGYYDRFFMKALKVVTLIKRDFERAFKNFDVLIAPTMPMPAFKLGEKVDDPLSLYLCDIDTVAVNLAGIPAISFPAGFSSGLPIGVQAIVPHLREDLALSVSYAFERNTEFWKRWPDL